MGRHKGFGQYPPKKDEAQSDTPAASYKQRSDVCEKHVLSQRTCRAARGRRLATRLIACTAGSTSSARRLHQHVIT